MGTESQGVEFIREIDPEDVPRCSEMDGSTLKIVPNFTEAGWHMEANCITVTDGERTAIYVPYRKGTVPTFVRRAYAECSGNSGLSEM